MVTSLLYIFTTDTKLQQGEELEISGIDSNELVGELWNRDVVSKTLGLGVYAEVEHHMEKHELQTRRTDITVNGLAPNTSGPVT